MSQELSPLSCHFLLFILTSGNLVGKWCLFLIIGSLLCWGPYDLPFKEISYGLESQTSFEVGHLSALIRNPALGVFDITTHPKGKIILTHFLYRYCNNVKAEKAKPFQKNKNISKAEQVGITSVLAPTRHGIKAALPYGNEMCDLPK